LKKTSDHYIKILNAQCANCYIVRRHYYDTLINNLEMGVTELAQNPKLDVMYGIDHIEKYYKKYNWDLIIPTNIVQIDYKAYMIKNIIIIFGTRIYTLEDIKCRFFLIFK